VVFLAPEGSDQWAGEDTEANLAAIIAESKGPAGYNVEYFILLHEYIKKFMPPHNDLHLGEIRRHIDLIFNKNGEKLEDKVRMGKLPVDEHFDRCEGCTIERRRRHM
jgi:hypothetical protein